MGFQKGNEYYKLRNTDGRECIYDNPKQLGEKAKEYFEWVQNNPFIEIDYKGKDAIKVEMPKMRPFSMGGLCTFLGIVINTFKNYKKKDDFLLITTHIEQIIDTQQFEGAAAGLLNPNIIARKLGLIDKTDANISGEVSIVWNEQKTYESEA
jgi:hypothetical protein